MRAAPSRWPAEIRAAVLACALTLIAAAAVIQSGAGARSLAFMTRTVDTEVVLFIVPTLAIVLAIFWLAVRLALGGSVPDLRRHRRQRVDWGRRPRAEGRALRGIGRSA